MPKSTIRAENYYGNFDVNSCGNPMCPQFGIGYGVETNRNQRAGVRNFLLKTRILRTKSQYAVCRSCGESSEILSNRALNETFRYFLGYSYPFATCPDKGCIAYQYNIFDCHRNREVRRNPFRIHFESSATPRATCKSCKLIFRFRHTKIKNKEMQARCASIFEALFYGLPIKKAMDYIARTNKKPSMSPDTY